MAYTVDGVLAGARMALSGALLAINDLKQRRWLYKTLLSTFIAMTVVFVLIYLILLLPLQLLRSLNTGLCISFGYSCSTSDSLFGDAYSTVTTVLSELPLFVVFLARHVYPWSFEKVFMQAIATKSPDFHQALKAHKYKLSYWQDFKKFLSRSYKTLRITLIVALISFMIPAVRDLVPSLATAYTLRNIFGTRAAVAFGAGSLLVSKVMAYRVAWVVLKTVLSSRQLARELLEPYSARVHTDHLWFRDHEAELLGFVMAFYPLMNMHFMVGPAVFVLAQASIAELIVEKSQSAAIHPYDDPANDLHRQQPQQRQRAEPMPPPPSYDEAIASSTPNVRRRA
ncbi:hypothetical protein GQ42DRAFT_164855 [Ramicandelaber brevisporus]|nr:hypothetical protein GQ42DRAFT_164855 [Ramicandelaber brevisporus]